MPIFLQYPIDIAFLGIGEKRIWLQTGGGF